MKDVAIDKTEERVLAYSLATEISEEEMSQVSGGFGTRTFGVTAKGASAEYDADEN